MGFYLKMRNRTIFAKMSKKEAPDWEPLEKNRITISAWSAGLLSEKCTQACKPWNSVRFVARKIELKPRI